MAAVQNDERARPETSSNQWPSTRSAGSSDATIQLDGRCMTACRDLLRPYEGELQAQAAFAHRFETASAYALRTVQRHASIAYEDFNRRIKTGTIPHDACNFHACLAGSVLLFGCCDVTAEGVDKIVQALVCRKVNVKRPGTSLNQLTVVAMST